MSGYSVKQTWLKLLLVEETLLGLQNEYPDYVQILMDTGYCAGNGPVVTMKVFFGRSYCATTSEQ